MSNISLKEFVTSNITVAYDSTLGSVTVDGTAAAANSVHEVEAEGSIALAATANSGATFMGWINTADNKLLSSDASFAYTPTGDATVKAIFRDNASTTPWFLVNNSYLFNDLNAAAGMTGAVTVVLMNNGTLPAGDYTIPAGVTLLIPNDSNNTVYTTAPNIATVADGAFNEVPAAITSYRKLTMENDANITVNGAISIGGTHQSGGLYAGCTEGAAGFIHMNTGSTITVESNAFLYAWGYITGSGNVTIKSSGTVYENFQVCGWRGGNVTTTMNSDAETYGVFPMSQYYVQNVEVPMKLEAGAIENTLLSVNISVIGVQKAPVAFIGGSDAMFHVTSGYVVKDYSESEDRMVITMYPDSTKNKGEVTISPTSITMKLGILGDTTIATQNYELPLTNNMRVIANSGTTITVAQDIAVLPGAEIFINEGANCTLSSGSNIYVYDVDEWGNYCGSNNAALIPLPNAPGRTASTRTASGLADAMLKINGTLDASAGYLYTTSGKANIWSDGSGVIKTQVGTQEITYQVTQGDPLVYNEIPITSAQLKNGDGSYTTTANASGTYEYYNGKWCCHTTWTDANCTTAKTCSGCGKTEGKALDHSYEAVITAPTCTEAGYTTYTCSACGDCYVDDEVAANGHTWSGTKCTVCGLFKLYATSLRAGDYLDMYFYVKASDLTEGQNYYAHVEKTFADGRDSVTRDIYYLNVDGTQNWETYQNDYLRFSFDDISAKEMTDEIHVTIYDASGNPVSTTTTETIQSYAVRLLSGLTGDGLSQKNQYLRTSLIDMLNYGAAAQDKFSYNTGDLATYGCDAYQEYATAEVTCDAGETDTSKGLDSASVIADNGLTLCLFFDNLNDADLTSLTASVSYTNHYGNAVSWTTSEFNTTNEGLVGVDIVGLAIADGRQLITCEVTNSANEVVASGTYSIERYLASNLEAHDVFSNLMKFIVSAYDYFHS